MSDDHKLSLLDIVLTKCVLNFQQLFFDENDSQLIFRKNIHLVPYLFEQIIDKSKEIGKCISPDLLWICLGFRDSLIWQKIDLVYLHSEKSLKYEDLQNIANSKVPVTKLTFFAEKVTETMMKDLSKLSKNLEHLHIETKCLDSLPQTYNAVYKKKTKFPKLRYLNLNLDNLPPKAINKIDLISFSETLHELVITKFARKIRRANEQELDDYSELLINAIGRFRNLEHLSISYFSMSRSNELFNAICSLKNLKSLTLYECRSLRMKHKKVVKFDMLQLLDSLPKLEKLIVNTLSVKWRNLESLETKRFKYLEIWGPKDVNIQQLDAGEIGHEGHVDGVLNMILNEEHPLKVLELFEKLHQFIVTPQTKDKILQYADMFLKRYPYYVENKYRDRYKYDSSPVTNILHHKLNSMRVA